MMMEDDATMHRQHPVCRCLKIGLQGGVHHCLASDLNHVIVEEEEEEEEEEEGALGAALGVSKKKKRKQQENE